MADWVKLRTGEGQHYDSEIDLHIRGKERKPLPDYVPAGGLTAQRLAIGGLVRCDPPAEASKQEACQETEERADATPSDPDTIEPDLADIPGQDEGEEVMGAADSKQPKEPIEQAAPAPSKKHASKRKART